MISTSRIATDKVPEIFNELAKQQIPLTLSRNYKGILLSQEVKVAEVHTDYIVIGTCDIHSFVEFGAVFYFHSNQLTKPIAARLMGCNPLSCSLYFTDFSYTKSNWVDRSNPRVHVNGVVPMVLHFGRYAIRTNLLDMSFHGLGTMIHRSLIQRYEIRNGSLVRCEFKLNNRVKFDQLNGRVANIYPVSDILARLGIAIQPKVGDTTQLKSYILTRQKEISDELEMLYFHMHEPPTVTSFYF